MKAVFDHNCPSWNAYIENNLMFLRYAEDYFNDLLKVRGWVTIFEIYNYLGLTLDFDKLGGKKLSDLMWWYNKGDKIDFGMKPDEDNRVIYLSFNIDID